ncbi:MAG: Fpg/Nei family DNA glycosylase, partial [Phycisphaerae bacterium]
DQSQSLELRFKDPRRFGGLWLLTGNEAYVGRRLGTVGPDPLQMRSSRFIRILERRKPIKSLLLDQTLIGGVGNIYCDESLFEASIHPQTPADQIDEAAAKRLLDAIKKVLRKAINHKGTTLIDYRTADGDEGGYRKFHRVYRRDGLPCKRCRAEIVRMVLGGRGTFICPACQKA